VRQVRKLVRPEDLGRDAGYRAPHWELLYSDATGSAPLAAVVGKCIVRSAGEAYGALRKS
jgi:hypothetical protein